MATPENKEPLARKRSSYPTLAVTDARFKRQRGIIEPIETETEKELKSLVQSQLKTNVTLGSVLKCSKGFTSSLSYAPKTVSMSGLHTLSEYQAATIEEDNVAELRSCGLTDDEIAVYIRHKNGVSSKFEQDEIEQIEQKIVEHRHTVMKQPQSLSATKYLNRHEMEIEASITKHRTKSKQFGYLVKPLEPVSTGSTIDQFWLDVQQRSVQLSTLTPRTKTKLNTTDNSSSIDNCECTDSSDTVKSTCTDNHVTDNVCNPVIENNGTAEVTSGCVVDNAAGVSISDRCTVEDSPVTNDRCAPVNRRIVTPSGSPIPEDVITRYRLSVDNILKLPKFSNYSVGQPSQVLYLKNLSSSVTEADLISLFGRYEQLNGDKIVYRLLSGRMHGQAFVTFTDEHIASQALQLVNGYHFKGKPIIIQFGHSRPAQSTTS